MLTFDHVTKTYPNGTKALVDVSFQVDAGEMVVLSGPSGSGKTTIIKLILKEITPTKGIIKIDSDDISKISSRNIALLRRKVGVVFQDFKILMDRTVAENIDLALDILGYDSEVIIKRRRELLKLTGLTDKENDFPIQLSGGQLQRVIIARALVGEPKILFADEPTGNLDSKTARGVIELLQEINKQGTTVILATHETDIVKGFDARHLELADGKLVKDTKSKNQSPKSKNQQSQANS